MSAIALENDVLAVGMVTGVIKVWNLDLGLENLKHSAFKIFEGRHNNVVIQLAIKVNRNTFGDCNH